MESIAAIDQRLSVFIIIVLGWFMIVLGALKMIIYLVGELAPGVWKKISSPTFKKILTGSGNRLLFGLGGFITLLLGVGAVWMAQIMKRLAGL